MQTNLAESQEYVGKLIPSWIDGGTRETLLGTENNSYCNKNKKGIACLAVILMDGWEIKDDYPW